MKKALAMVIAGALALSLAACTSKPAQTPASGSEGTKPSSGTTSSQPVELTYWMHSSAALDVLMDELVVEFNEANPDIIVKTEYIPFDDYMSKLIPALGTGTGPDVFKIQQGMVGKLAQAGSIQPLDEAVLPGSMIESEYLESTVGGMKYEDKYYGMPTDNQSIILYWNKDLAQQAGLDAENGPKDWDEFYDWARKMTKSENGVMTQSGWGSNGYWPEVQSYLEQSGGKFYDEAANKFVFADDTTTMDALSKMVDLYRVDKVYDVDFSKNWAGFRIGLVGMMLGHPGMIGNLATTAPDVNIGTAPIPATNGNSDTVVTSWGFVASSEAPSDAATRFIQFLSSEEVMKRFCTQTGELPSRKALLNDADLKANPHYAVGLDSLNNSVVGRLQTGSMNTIWSKYWGRLQSSTDDVTTIMKACQEELNAELAADVK